MKSENKLSKKKKKIIFNIISLHNKMKSIWNRKINFLKNIYIYLILYQQFKDLILLLVFIHLSINAYFPFSFQLFYVLVI